MKLKKLLELYDNWDETIVVSKFNNREHNGSKRLFKGDTHKIGFDENGKYKKLRNMEVSHFDFYDNIFYVTVK